MKISETTGVPSASPNVPDGLPTLSRGRHDSGEGEACVMEYVSILAGEEFSDHPGCTHPFLALAARTVNDNLPDEERYRLVPLIGRLFGTNDESPHVFAGLRPLLGFSVRAAKAGEDCACFFCRIKELDYDGAIEFLSSMIDKYDELTGRTETCELSDADLRDLAEAVQSTSTNQEVVTA